MFPIHYVYGWLGQYFETHHHHSRLRSGAQMIKLAGERMAKYFNALEATTFFKTSTNQICRILACPKTNN